jgi:phenylacetate-coenzyme A ligase PaaK-like adenylate-forming protein
MSEFIHFRQNRKSDFFGSVEVEVFTEQGKPCILEIKEVEYKENFMVNGKKKDRAIVLYFQGQKPWICNSTNCNIIKKLTSQINAKKWIGVKIELYVDYNVKFAKDTVSGVRVRESLPNVVLPKLEIGTEGFEKCLKALCSGSYTMSDLRK